MEQYLFYAAFSAKPLDIVPESVSMSTGEIVTRPVTVSPTKDSVQQSPLPVRSERSISRGQSHTLSLEQLSNLEGNSSNMLTYWSAGLADVGCFSRNWLNSLTYCSVLCLV